MPTPNPDAVYDVLVREAGALEHHRQAFKIYVRGPNRYKVWHLPRRLYYVFESSRVDGVGLIADNTKARTNAALAALEVSGE